MNGWNIYTGCVLNLKKKDYLGPPNDYLNILNYPGITYLVTLEDFISFPFLKVLQIILMIFLLYIHTYICSEYDPSLSSREDPRRGIACINTESSESFNPLNKHHVLFRTDLHCNERKTLDVSIPKDYMRSN